MACGNTGNRESSWCQLCRHWRHQDFMMLMCVGLVLYFIQRLALLTLPQDKTVVNYPWSSNVASAWLATVPAANQKVHSEKIMGNWSIACWCCSNYIFIVHSTPGFNILHKNNCKTRRDTFKFGDLVPLILENLLYSPRSECEISIPVVHCALHRWAPLLQTWWRHRSGCSDRVQFCTRTYCKHTRTG